MNEIAHVTKEEIARQTVILAFGVLGVVATLKVGAWVSDPDAMRTLKMATALEVKRFCQRRADMFQDWADRAATLYNKEKA